MVGEAAVDRAAEVRRLLADIERLRGGLRIAIRQTDDGLGIHIPPARRIGPVLFLSFWLCGWAVGEYFALAELLRSGLAAPDLFLLVWIVPWTIGGALVIWTIVWQLFGVERLYFTAGALVREWGLLALRGRRVLPGSVIREVTISTGSGPDLAGLGTIRVATTGRPMRIGNGLSKYEAELVAKLIRDAAAEPSTAGDGKSEADRPADG